MIFKEYIYFLSVILNCINFLKGYKRSFYSSIFFIFKNLVFIILFNVMFKVLVNKFNVIFLDIKFLLFIFLSSILLYFLKRKYVCITFSGTLVYFICKILNYSICLKNIIFLIGILHLFEGIFIFFSNNKKLYLPLMLSEFPIIFMIFYSRDFKLEMIKYSRFVSGGVILIYGIIVLFISVFKNNFIHLILICILHETTLLIEKILINNLKLK